MRYEIQGNEPENSHGVLKVYREEGDPKFYGIKYGAGESRLLYHIKKMMNKDGWDLIKKRMWKDGHMVDDLQQYLRSRTPNSGERTLCIYNTRWAIEGAEQSYNKNGYVKLQIVWDVFEEE